MKESFARNKGKRLEYLFDLKYQTIRKISISILIVELSINVLLIAIDIIGCRILCINEKSDMTSETKKNISFFYSIISIFFGILIVIGGIGKYVLFLLLLHFIESGDIGKFDDFLDCRNVKEEYFENFDDTFKLKRCFLAFAILNIISESLDKVKGFLEKYIENEKKIEKNPYGINDTSSSSKS